MYKYQPLVTAIVTVGQRGTVVIPAHMRKDMGLECGSTLAAVWDGKSLRLTPVPSDSMDRLAWAINQAYEGMTAEEVEKSLRELRDEWPD